MKISNQRVLIVVLLLLLFSSCEKDITFKLPDQTVKLVVEGWIEQDQFPEVILTKSSPYFSPIDTAALLSSIVQDANVYISNGTTTEKLSLVYDSQYPFFFYKGDTMKGEIGKTYNLTILYEGNTYTATTSIQPLAKFDSVWFKLNPNSDSIGNVFGYATDDGSVYNYYRAYTKILHVDTDFVPIYGSVWDDKFFSGQSLTAQLYHGIASNIVSPSSGNDRGLGYKLGDTVMVKLCTLDYETYKFWVAAESEIYSTGNPFATTTSIPSMISGGALGCFSGYGATYNTLVCK